MNVFISWSGERSKVLGETLRDWMPLVVPCIKPWLSQADIEPGQRWADTLAEQLNNSHLGIICITRDNVTSPWVLFEAGALSKAISQTQVIPLLLDLSVRDLVGPLAQFQAVKVEREGLLKTISSLNRRTPKPLDESIVESRFDEQWEGLSEAIRAIPRTARRTKQTRPEEDILEELVTSVRSTNAMCQQIAQSEAKRSRYNAHRVFATWLSRICEELNVEQDDPLFLLVIASFFRDGFPWLYELGVDAHRMAIHGSLAEYDAARRRFWSAFTLVRGSWRNFASADGLDHELEAVYSLLHDFAYTGTEGGPDTTRTSGIDTDMG